MDFTPTTGQQDAATLAREILRDRCTAQRLTEVERAGDRFDRDLWREIGRAGLIGLPLPEEAGGAGLGILELASVLEEAGRVVAPLPLAAHVPTAMAIARFGSTDQRTEWLSAAASGDRVLTAAVTEDRADAPQHPTTNARRDGDGWVLSGTKTTVPAGTVADLFVVPASTDDGVELFLVCPDDQGVQVQEQLLSDGDAAARVELDAVRLAGDRLLAGGRAAYDWLVQHLTVAASAHQLGVCAGALDLTAAYARTREQFGRPIGSFQAVSQRLADGYIDVQGLRLTVTHAAWRLAEGLPAAVEVGTAKLWAADTGHKIAHTTVHVHGGVGIDLDGEAHRYFTAAKRTEFALGGSTVHALALGKVLAAEPV